MTSSAHQSKPRFSPSPHCPTRPGSSSPAVVGLRPGSYRVSAALEHYNEAVAEGIPAGASNVALVLQPLSAVEGNVLDGQAKKPLTRFSVLYLKAPPGDDRHWQNIIRGETTKWTPVNNEEGTYRIEDVLSDTEVAVAASTDGFEPAYAVVPPVKPGETAQAPDVSLLPEAKLLGRVVSEEHEPLSGADIYFGAEARGRNAARSNPDGRFTIGQLPPGPVTLTASHPDHLPATVQATLTRGKETEVACWAGAVPSRAPSSTAPCRLPTNRSWLRA
ncbi:MAG: carboxypeptidase-like regulatory domain-containing protein [Candidatus Hydrogenedentes bacterium]|nr:carboxypeptidase-like regulatory domain-containing protein [Candidatus Hydrogenedentota bacterium]